MYDNFSFELSRFPRIVYGEGVINVLSEKVKDHADTGRLMTRQPRLSMQQAHQRLIQLLRDWTKQMGLQLLSAYGVTADDVTRLVENISASSMKTNPILLTQEEKEQLVLSRL